MGNLPGKAGVKLGSEPLLHGGVPAPVPVRNEQEPLPRRERADRAAQGVRAAAEQQDPVNLGMLLRRQLLPARAAARR